MGPSCGGFTCSFAPFRLLSTIQDTRSARPCPNSGVSTPAATFRAGGAVVASATAVGLTPSCAAPAAEPSTDVVDSSESPVPPDARLSAAPAPASAVPAGAAAAAFADTSVAGRAAEMTGAGTGTGGPLGSAGPGDLAAVAGVADSFVGNAEKSAPPAVPVLPGPTVPVAAADMAAAVTACAFASVLVEAPVLVDGFVDEGVAGGALPSAARLAGVGREAAESTAAVV